MIRNVWCTGAGRGLGRALSLRLARDGMVVAASSRTSGELESLVSAAASLPGRIHSFPVDVTNETSVAATVRAIEERLGTIDLAVLNAGTHLPVLGKEFDAEPFRRLFAVNVMGVVHGLAAILPRFIERRRGHVAVVASVAGYRGLPTGAAYGATKAALINLCEALKPELDGYGVCITVINPGFVRTPLTDLNPFKMPFLMEADAAAERIVQGLRSGRFEITFPRRFTWPMKLLRCLPYPLAFAITRRLVPQSG